MIQNRSNSIRSNLVNDLPVAADARLPGSKGTPWAPRKSI